ncbi:MAG: hypothetical protein SFW09_03220 [Hyphomicrobiaceae bacterium]|nr:hypothetical protein [Hyphomicrobiaceae bacterium]
MVSVLRMPVPVNPVAKATERSRKNFLGDVVIEHGPRDVLSRVLLKSDTEMRRIGINLSFADFDELAAVNRANADNWHPLVSVFDPYVGGASQDNGFALIGWNSDGDAVAALCARYYPLAGCTLKEEMESLRLLYADPARSRRPGETLTVTAPMTGAMTGGAVYLGGLWYRPDYRGRGLHPVISPIVRALSYTRWASQIGFSLMSRENVETGVARRARFRHVEWGATWTNSPVFPEPSLELAVVWTTADEQLAHFAEFASAPPPREMVASSS